MTGENRVFVAGHRGLVGSALVRRLQRDSSIELLLRTHAELDLTNQAAVRGFFEHEKPEQVYLAAARVGGILANDTRPAEFIQDNLVIQSNVIDAAYRNGTRKLLFLGSSCIYPETRAAAHAGELPADWSAGTDQRVVCHCQDCRPQDLPGLSQAVRVRCHLRHAYKPVRTR